MWSALPVGWPRACVLAESAPVMSWCSSYPTGWIGPPQFWAAAFLGAVVVPVVHFYGRKELSHILGESKAKVFITAERFGRMQFEPDVCADVPIVGVVGRDFERLLAGRHRCLAR